jgi:imidazolonepropionase-like amidohydrolase
MNIVPTVRPAISLFLFLGLFSGCSKQPSTDSVQAETKSPATTSAEKPAAVGKLNLLAPKSTLFRNVRVFDGKSALLSQPTNVLVVGNVISAIGTNAAVIDADTLLIDGNGKTLMPGLIDNHVHITMSSWSQEDALADGMTPAKLEVRAAEQAEAMLLRGFTSVRDLGGPIFGLKTGIDKGNYNGPRIWPSGAMISQTSGHGDGRLPNERSRRFFNEVSKSENLGVNFIADGRDEVLTATRENLRFGASQIKVMAGGGAATAYDPLDVSQYTFDELKAAVEAADDWNTYVTVHAYTVRAVRRAIDAGVKCIEHGQLLDEATIKLMADQGIWLSLQVLDPPPANANPFNAAKKMQVIEGTDNAYRWAKKYGVKLAWGTDFLFDPKMNAGQNNNMLKLKQWFTAREILKMVTHDNAQLLALSGPRSPYAGKLGVVETGALADLLLVDGDPLANIDVLADPQKNFALIMKDGKIYKNIMSK